MKQVYIHRDEWVIKLHQSEADSFLAKATKKAEKYQTISTNSPYGFNHIHSHYVGLVSEHAAWLFFNEIEELLGRDLNIDAVYQNPKRDAECDLVVNGTKIEVKCIKYGSWLRYGPCISTKQYPKIKEKADVVLWLLYNEKSQELTVKGFTDVNDVPTITPVLTGTEDRKVENYPVLSIMKNMNELKL